MSVDDDSLAATGILDASTPGLRAPTGPAHSGIADSLASVSATSPLSAAAAGSAAASTSPGTSPSSISTGTGAGLNATRLIGGRYEILALLGQGGMGRVYRARDTELDELVALKVLQSELVSSPEMVERFRREVKLARRVTHPNVARMFDISTRQPKNPAFLLTYAGGRVPPRAGSARSRRAPTRSHGITTGSRA